MSKEEESPLDYDLRLTKKIGTTLGAISLLGAVASNSPVDTKPLDERRIPEISTELASRTQPPAQNNSDEKTTRYMEFISEQRRKERAP
ncbi:MAG: hypothetical protein ABL867_04805, partial [Rickettsiales bacterium]